MVSPFLYLNIMSYWRNKDWLYEQYIINKLSWREIAEKVGKSAATVSSVAKKHGINSRTVEEVTQKVNIPINEIQKYYESGWSIADIAKHYGVVFSTIQAKMKKHKITARSAGVGSSTSYVVKHNLLPREEWANRQWLTEQYQDHSINGIATKIGWSYTAVCDTMKELGIITRDSSEAIKMKWLDESYKNKCLIYSPPKSKIQNKLYKLLDEMGVEYIPEGPGTKLLKYYRPLDCIVPRTSQKSLIIEVNGYLHLRRHTITKDKSKAIHIAKYLPDYELCYLWDHDFASMDFVQKLCKIIGIDKPNCDFLFSDLDIVQISYSEAKTFLDLYHYLGKGRGGICYGIKLNDKLICVAVFSPPIRNNIKFDSDFRELSRLCVHPMYHKHNLLSWFLSRVCRKIPSDLIVAYADSTVGHTGAVYKACNWYLHHVVPADYSYMDSDGVYMHKATLYCKAKAACMTENEFVGYFGYRKIYGAEKFCFVLDQR